METNQSNSAWHSFPVGQRPRIRKGWPNGLEGVKAEGKLTSDKGDARQLANNRLHPNLPDCIPVSVWVRPSMRHMRRPFEILTPHIESKLLCIGDVLCHMFVVHQFICIWINIEPRSLLSCPWQDPPFVKLTAHSLEWWASPGDKCDSNEHIVDDRERDGHEDPDQGGADWR